MKDIVLKGTQLTYNWPSPENSLHFFNKNLHVNCSFMLTWSKYDLYFLSLLFLFVWVCEIFPASSVVHFRSHSCFFFDYCECFSSLHCPVLIVCFYCHVFQVHSSPCLSAHTRLTSCYTQPYLASPVVHWLSIYPLCCGSEFESWPWPLS